MKVYLVNRKDIGEYSSATLMKIFSTFEKAQVHVYELEESSISVVFHFSTGTFILTLKK